MMKTLLILVIGGASVALCPASTPAPEPKPVLAMLDAIRMATDHVVKTKSLKNHYLDRVWLGRARGEKEKKWIVSWCPDGEAGRKQASGWIIVTVDMGGTVSEPRAGVSWIDQTLVDSVRASLEAEAVLKEAEEKLRKVRAKE